ncbi:MAG TPA: rhodanese-like domain-containing protein [Flavobacteriales bacterium]|nr:rhodanese-like domain-containing protein [Flavobacteriales bacterium]
MDLRNLVKMPGATIVDVRSPMEYMGGHVAGSINIPLQEIPTRMDELRGLTKPLILCCASGNRSGHAAQFLQQHGLQEVYNGGGWMQVNAACAA